MISVCALRQIGLYFTSHCVDAGSVVLPESFLQLVQGMVSATPSAGTSNLVFSCRVIAVSTMCNEDAKVFDISFAYTSNEITSNL